MSKKFSSKVVLASLAMLLIVAGCESDSISNGPVAGTLEMSSGTAPLQIDAQQINDSANPKPAGSATQGLIGDILKIRIVSGIVTPLLGGTLNLLSSQLVVPPLAVVIPRFVTFSMISVTPAGLPNALNRTYDFSPDGLNFLIPSKLYVSFTDAGLSGGNPNQYHCYYLNESTNTWEVQPTTIDIQNQRFIVTLNHFSRYAFAR